ncbi:MAG: hypothetical protein HKO05_09470 [Erythrobacter sp.]|jgi:hypothetical protein|nr:hypothetical protein [Erythrobacter sp.]
MRKIAATILLSASLAGCVTAPAGTTAVPPPRENTVRVPPTRPAPPPVASTGEFLTPRIMNIPGLEGIIGATASQLQRQFGNPRLDVYEGDARKLQFTGEACVLDIYLYPLQRGAEPTATYVDARRASDALDVDRVACVRALKRR